MSKKGGIDIPWWLVFVLFCVAAPMGIVALVLKIVLENSGRLLPDPKEYNKLSGKNPTQKTGAPTAQYPGSSQPAGANTRNTASSSQYSGSYRSAGANTRNADSSSQYSGSYQSIGAKPASGNTFSRYAGGQDAPQAPAVKKTAHPAPVQSAVRKTHSKAVSKPVGKKLPSTGGATALTTLGVIFGSVSGILFIITAAIFLGKGLNLALLSTSFGFAMPAGILLILGMTTRKRKLAMRRLMQLIGQNKQVPIARLATLTGMDAAAVEQTLEQLIAQGYFEQAYIDYENHLFRIGDPFAQSEQEKKEAQTLRTAANDKESLTAPAQKIREINDRIAHPLVSQKMYRLEELTEKIYSYVLRRPSRKEKLKSFEEYYLPNTLKILEAYADFEQQGIDGDNINTTMADIEEVLDTLIAGFEKTLDNLFADEAMDISTDITVLENMLGRDGIGTVGFPHIKNDKTD